MRDPGKNIVNERKLVVFSLIYPCPAHVLPDQVHGCCAVEQNSTDRTDHGSEGSSKRCAFCGSGIKAVALKSDHCQRDTDIGYGTNVCGNGSAGGYQSNVNDLHRSADHDAGGDVAKNYAADKTADEGSAQRVVTDGCSAQTRHTGKGCE